jgi:hypothetical protein
MTRWGPARKGADDVAKSEPQNAAWANGLAPLFRVPCGPLRSAIAESLDRRGLAGRASILLDLDGGGRGAEGVVLGLDGDRTGGAGQRAQLPRSALVPAVDGQRKVLRIWLAQAVVHPRTSCWAASTSWSWSSKKCTTDSRGGLDDRVVVCKERQFPPLGYPKL